MAARRPLVRQGGRARQLASGDSIDSSCLAVNLNAFAGLSGAADRLPYFTGAGALSLATLTAFGRDMLAAADSSEGRTALGLGTAATANVTTSATDTTAGRVTKVGDFGIGALLLNAAGNLISNLNDLSLASGIYGYGASATGAPTGDPGALLVMRFGNSAMRQVAWPMNGTAVVNSEFTRQLRAGPTYDPWVSQFHSGNTLELGASQGTALAALGLTGLTGRVDALESGGNVTNLGAVATSAAQTVNADVGTSKFFTASMEAANTTGALTLNFTNVPASATAVTTWHVELLRGGRKTVAFQLDGAALTPVWAGGGAPTLNNTAGSRDLLMFYRMPGRSAVYAMLVDSGTA